MTIKNAIITFSFILFSASVFAQSKMEMQKFISQDLKNYSGTWLHTHNGNIVGKSNEYNFTVQNCDLIITSKHTSDGLSWGDSKTIIPIADISEVNLIPSETRGVTGNIWTASTRLQIKTSGYSVKRYWNGNFIDFDNSVILGLGSYTSDLAQKYKSVFREFSKYCE